MSDSSYDPDETPEAPQAAPTSCSTGSCSTGSCCCPCSSCYQKIKPENIEGTLAENVILVDKFQEILMLKRPIALVALVLYIDFEMLLYHCLNLPFLANCCLLALNYILFKVLKQIVWPILTPILFGGDINRGTESEPNRIRTSTEVAAALNKVLVPLSKIVDIFVKLHADKSNTGLLIWAGVLFAGFVLTASVDFFWIIFILVNCLLLLPGICLNPTVIKLYNDKVAPLLPKSAPGESQAPAAESPIPETPVPEVPVPETPLPEVPVPEAAPEPPLEIPEAHEVEEQLSVEVPNITE